MIGGSFGACPGISLIAPPPGRMLPAPAGSECTGRNHLLRNIHGGLQPIESCLHEIFLTTAGFKYVPATRRIRAIPMNVSRNDPGPGNGAPARGAAHKRDRAPSISERFALTMAGFAVGARRRRADARSFDGRVPRLSEAEAGPRALTRVGHNRKSESGTLGASLRWRCFGGRSFDENMDRGYALHGYKIQSSAASLFIGERRLGENIGSSLGVWTNRDQREIKLTSKGKRGT